MKGENKMTNIEKFILESCQSNLGSVPMTNDSGYVSATRPLRLIDYLQSTEMEYGDFLDVITDIEKEYQIIFENQEAHYIWKSCKVEDLVRATQGKINAKAEKVNAYNAEELECVNTWLDKYNVPKEIDGNTYSTIGRIRWLIVFLRNSDPAKADKIYCDIFNDFYNATTGEKK